MNRRLGFAGLMALLALIAPQAHAGTIDSGLQDILDSRADDDVVSVIIVMKDQVDIAAATRQMDQERATLRRRHEFVVLALQDASDSQRDILASIMDLANQGVVFDVQPFWIRNMIRVDTYKGQIEALAARTDVQGVYYNYEVELIQPVKQVDLNGGDNVDPATAEVGVRAVRAPEVWALGIDGTGVLTSNTDTGVDGNHPALASRWAGVADSRYNGHPQWAWFDPTHGNDNFPYDNNGHGTHTMGTVCGGAPGREIGVAPGAHWIAAAPIDRISIQRTVSDVLLSYQWFLDPDGNPSTNFDVPAVNSNSWGVTTGHGYPNCDQTFWVSIDACEAAGIVMLYSAGNEGPTPNSLRRPADRATTDYNCLAVAAVDANDSRWPIASFSSRGPTNCTPNGGQAIKPDIAAPGVNVLSSLPGNNYGQLSGTSMASPHVNGVVTLMRQANPDISVDDLKQVLYETAHDLGSAGQDNDYGWGMIDAYEAVNRIMNTNTPYACCFEDGHCEDLLAQDCRAAGGTPSFGKTCGEVSCPQPGACCLDDGSCQHILEKSCSLIAGASWSSGDCNSVQCEQPGACCFDDGTCQILGPLACENAGGNFSGHGVSCQDAACPQPGACCVSDSDCEILGPEACAAARGSFKGHGTSCEGACPCDKIKKLRAKCKDNDDIKGTVVIRDDSYNAKIVKVSVDGVVFTLGVIERKAKLIAGPFPAGSHTIRLVEPACGLDQVVTCP